RCSCSPGIAVTPERCDGARQEAGGFVQATGNRLEAAEVGLRQRRAAEVAEPSPDRERVAQDGDRGFEIAGLRVQGGDRGHGVGEAALVLDRLEEFERGLRVDAATIPVAG